MVLQSERTKAATTCLSEKVPKPERRDIGDSRVHWEVLDSEKDLKKELTEEGDFDVFYSPSSVPLDEGLEDIKEVDERETNMAEEEDNIMEEESEVDSDIYEEVSSKKLYNIF